VIIDLYLHGPPAVSAVLRNAAVGLEHAARLVDEWHARAHRLRHAPWGAAKAGRVDGAAARESRWSRRPAGLGVDDAVLVAILAFFALAVGALLSLP
jgi:hypothetical protein